MISKNSLNNIAPLKSEVGGESTVFQMKKDEKISRPKNSLFRSLNNLLIRLWWSLESQFNKIFHSKHHYVNKIYLGKFENLTPQKIMDAVRNCNIFPMAVLAGGIKNKDSEALITLPCLSFLKGRCGTGNAVVVKEAGDTFVTLEAGDTHLFKGIARHEIIKEDNAYYWQVTGDSPKEGEEFWRSILNTLFSKMGMWNLLVRNYVVPKLSLLNELNNWQPFFEAAKANSSTEIPFKLAMNAAVSTT